MDTNLGQVSLTETQIENMASVPPPSPFKGFCVWPDKVVAVSDTEPTEQQKADAVAWLEALPTAPCYVLCKGRFSYTLFSGMLNNTLSFASIAKLGNHMRTLEGYCQWKNFIESDLGNPKNAKSFVDYLESSEAATEAEANAIRAAFAAQGIDIS